MSFDKECSCEKSVLSLTAYVQTPKVEMKNKLHVKGWTYKSHHKLAALTSDAPSGLIIQLYSNAASQPKPRSKQTGMYKYVKVSDTEHVGP